MELLPTRLPEVSIVRPRVFGDERGFFMETWRESVFREAGLDFRFIQDNHSRSVRHTLRGLHFQLHRPQGKLVRVVSGEIFDVAVDLRRSSPRFGEWVGARLSAENREQLWIPPGFAHGFLVLSEMADVLYKCTEYYAPDAQGRLRWNDPRLAIDWPLPQEVEPLLSEKDRDAPGLDEAEGEAYP